MPIQDRASALPEARAPPEVPPRSMEELLARLVHLPALQGALVATSAMVSEDATALASGALVGGRQMPFLTAFLGLAAGIALGDVLFFALGRTAAARLGGRDLVDPRHASRMAALFERYGPWVILGARCLPGTRLPTYMAAGAVRTRWRTFLLLSLPAAVLWSYLLLLGLSSLSHVLEPWAAKVQWAFLGVGAVVVLLLVRNRRRRRAALAEG